MELLIIATVVIGLLVLLGIGAGTVLKWLFSPRRRMDNPTLACPRCGAAIRPRMERCAACGFIEHRAVSPATHDLAATRRVLSRLAREQKIDAATHARLVEVLKAEQQSIKVSESEPVLLKVAEPTSDAEAAATGPTAAVPVLDLAPADLGFRQAVPTASVAPAPPAPPPAPPAPVEIPSVTARVPAARPAIPKAPPKPRRRFSDVFAGFMEERNIRWGELVGGLLIVGCSIALVLSLWDQIARFPLLKLTTFTGLTAAMFGAGLYTAHRWKLPTTSRGILLIATLLVPLNMLGIGAAGDVGRSPAVMLIGEIVALAVFAGLVWQAGKVIMPGWAVLLAVAVVGCAAVESAGRRLAAPGVVSASMLYAFSAAALALYGGPAIAAIRGCRRQQRLGGGDARILFTMVGAGAFAALPAIGLLVYRSGDVMWALRRLAPAIPLLAGPAMAAGLLVWRRVTDAADNGFRVAGTAVAALAAMAIVGALAVAWPAPAMLIPVALLDAAILGVIVWRYELPAGWTLVAGCLAAADLAGAHLTAGHVGWFADAHAMRDALLSAMSGTALVPLATAFVTAAGLARRRASDSAWLLYSGIGLAAVSLILVSLFGLGRSADGGAFWVYAIYAVASLAAAWRLRSAEIAWVGSVLLLAALAQGAIYSPGLKLARPWPVVLLIHATLLTSLAIAARVRSVPKVMRTLCQAAVVGVAVAAVWVLVSRHEQPLLTSALQGMWLAAIVFALALVGNSWGLFWAGQTALAAAGGALAVALVPAPAWHRTGLAWQPWTLEVVGVVVGSLNLMWLALRLALRRVGLRPTLLNPPEAAFDHCATGVVLLGALLLGLRAAFPGVLHEFGRAGDALRGSLLPLGAWPALLLAVMGTVLIAGLWEQFNRWRAIGLLVVAAAASIFIAALAEPQRASASLLRWQWAGIFLVGSMPVWFRHRLAMLPQGLGWPANRAELPAARNWAVLFLRVIAIAIVVLSVLPLLLALGGHLIAGPAQGNFFWRIGAGASYGVPLVLVAGGMAIYAIRDKSPAYALAASGTLGLTATLAYLHTLVSAGVAIGGPQLVQLGQIDAAVLAGCALAWMAVARWRRGRGEAYAPVELKVLSAGTSLLFVLATGHAGVALARAGGSGSAAGVAGGGVLGWGAGLLVLVAVLARRLGARLPLAFDWIGAAAVGIAVLMGLALAPWSSASWMAYHTMLLGMGAAAWAVLAAGWLSGAVAGRSTLANISAGGAGSAVPGEASECATWLGLTLKQLRLHCALWTLGVGLLTLALGYGTLFGDPDRPWWFVGALVTTGALCAGLSVWTSAGRYLYGAAMLLCIAANIAWPKLRGLSSIAELIELNIIAIAAPCGLWMWIEVYLVRPALPLQPRFRLPMHRFGAAAALALLMLLTTLCVALQLGGWSGAGAGGDPVLKWGALLAAAIAVLGCLWDSQARLAVVAAYLLGLTLAARALTLWPVAPQQMPWAGGLALSAYALVTCWLWSMHGRLAGWAVAMRVPVRRAEAQRAWLAPATGAVTLAGGLIALHVVLSDHDCWRRLISSLAVAAEAIAIGLLASRTDDESRKYAILRPISLYILGISAVFFGWAWLSPQLAQNCLNHAVVAVVALAATVGSIVVILRRPAGVPQEWSAALRGVAGPLAGVTIAAILATLAMEVAITPAGSASPMARLSAIAMVVMMLGLATVAVIFAVVPALDPLKLSERRRTAYVYAAELTLALLFLHVKWAWPDLLRIGIWRRFWPVILVGISFLGVGLGELFRRQRRPVLAEPLERTGIFLPLLPLAAFWFAQSHRPYVSYDRVLFAVALLWGVFAAVRRSFAWALLAALAGNVGLWFVLGRIEVLAFTRHPQAWLLPAALSILVAAQLNRHRLSAQQLGALRYLGLLTIYISSTADIFLTGVAESPWLPLVLAGLAIAGVFAGILLRVQSFLFTGALFIIVAVMSMIWHAAENYHWTWLWWVAGILTGIAIMTVFALFEKKREEMLRLVEGLRHWER